MKTKHRYVSSESCRNNVPANTAKTKQHGDFAVNRQIFSLDDRAKKLYQLIIFFLLSFICSSVYAGSTPNGSPTLKTSTTSVKLPNITSDTVDYSNLSTYPDSLVSTSLTWTKQVGATSGDTKAMGVSADSNGNSYVTGYTTKGISGQIQNGINDYFIAKYDVSGNLLWAKQVGAYNGYTQGKGISTDNSGNIYVTGETTKGLSGQTQNSSRDYFIAKYDAAGDLIWSRQVGAGGGTSTYGTGVSADKSGNSYVTGWTIGTLAGQQKKGDMDYFIAKYDQSGNLIWTRQTGSYPGGLLGDGVTEGFGISADNSGNVYVSGFTVGAGLSGQKQNGLYDYFIAKYSESGYLIWTKQVGAPGGTKATKGYGISADNSGNIYVTGFTTAGISGQTQNGKDDYFIAQYNADGELIWTKQVGASDGYTQAKGVSADNLGNIYVTGYTNKGISGQSQNGGANDYFIAKYGQSGNLVWAQQSGTSCGVGCGNTQANGISANGNNIYIAGSTNIGINGQTQTGGWDYFIAKYVN